MDASNTSAISVDRLVKLYKGVAAVDGISFRLPPGSITGLLGGNGAGKSTTIAMIMGLVTPTAGTVSVLGTQMPKERYRVLHRMNFESPYVALPMRLTVRQNLSVFAQLYAVADIDERIAGLAAGFAIKGCLIGEDLHRRRGEAALREHRRALHVKHNIVRCDVAGNAVVCGIGHGSFFHGPCK